MTRAVFFDWFNTLALYKPPREELHCQALREFGINISPQKIKPGLLIADGDYLTENATFPIRQRSPEEQAKIYAHYQQTVLTEAGVNLSNSPDIFTKIIEKLQELYKEIRFVLFDDVLSTLKTLKKQNLTLGLLTNMDTDMKPICSELGLEVYLDFIVTSGEAGADKPQPQIFLTALQQAGVKASEAVHVGDQYKIDVIGARGVGINPILIDRYNLFPEVTDCPRIHSLSELTEHL
ncbi:Phosphoglycolate phosphatase [subsurface metagenome]